MECFLRKKFVSLKASKSEDHQSSLQSLEAENQAVQVRALRYVHLLELHLGRVEGSLYDFRSGGRGVVLRAMLQVAWLRLTLEGLGSCGDTNRGAKRASLRLLLNLELPTTEIFFSLLYHFLPQTPAN